jgi:response regulator of citrate/malate metabolism
MNVLILEDCQKSINDLDYILRKNGISNIFGETNSNNAVIKLLRLIETYDPKTICVISSENLSDDNTLFNTTAIHKVKYIHISPRNEFEYISLAADLGVSNYLIKPFTSSLLMAKVDINKS